ncbi:Branched-chain acyl-CoA dehydrogenase [hydrothermal vent metagenome]|uniref:Branched-chain acyl-CoA dehydrogenase n=1 Tax=hydrothermal vent metagenome TaxID=652676 RepID=A0A3B0TCA1_9ZZZZ
MDFELSEDARAFAQVARDFAAEKMAPFAREWDETCHFPVETLREAAGLGFAGLYVRDDVGGTGASRLDAAIVLEELARGCTSTAAFLSIHNMVSWMIDAYGTGDQRQRYLPALTSMELIASYCLTEPGAGSDAAALKCRARPSGNGYVLNGTKAFISGGARSDIYLVMARTGEDGPRGVSAFLVEKDTQGLTFGAQEAKMGWRSQPTSMVNFDDCFVGADALVGGETGLGRGFNIAMTALDGGRVNIAATALGTAQFAFEQARAYLGERRQFGHKLKDFQALRFRIADMATELAAARLMVWRAAVAIDTDAPDRTMLCAMAKRFGTDTAFNVVNEALQLHGGYGYLRDFPLERNLRDVRVHQILEGTNEIMRVIISRALLDGPS